MNRGYVALQRLACTAIIALFVHIPGVALAGEAGAATAPREYPTFELRALDTHGDEVAVPDPEKVAVVVYVMLGQERSHRMLVHVQDVVADVERVNVLAVVSGTNAETRARRLPELTQWTHRVVPDPDYRLSDAGNVIAWPTAVIVDTRGRRSGHIAGLTSRFVAELTAHIEFAADQIDRPTLQQRLDADEQLAASPHAAAARHLAAAQRWMQEDQLDAAERELREALQLQPRAAQIRLALAQVMLRRGQAEQALTWIDRITDRSTLAAWQFHAIRGRALAALEQWEQARDELTQAIHQNPDPAACYYDLGRAHEHFGDWQSAAKAYRAAYEHTQRVHDTATGR